jgi:hypothetical protein
MPMAEPRQDQQRIWCTRGAFLLALVGLAVWLGSLAGAFVLRSSSVWGLARATVLILMCVPTCDVVRLAGFRVRCIPSEMGVWPEMRTVRLLVRGALPHIRM